MAYTVARPKLTFAEKAYLPAIMTGLGITLRHFLEKRVARRMAQTVRSRCIRRRGLWRPCRGNSRQARR